MNNYALRMSLYQAYIQILQYHSSSLKSKHKFTNLRSSSAKDGMFIFTNILDSQLYLGKLSNLLSPLL